MNDLKIEKERLPRWMKSVLPKGESYLKVKRLIADHHLNTICTSGNCPNKGECWNAGTASFMILGDKCTRNCRFCFVQNEVPDPVDWLEPLRLAKTIHTLGLKHCVITSVTRDDLADGGAEFWAATIRKIKELNPGTTIETLIPDFNANPTLLAKVLEAAPDVISHNMETVRRLTPKVRSTARYDRSLRVISMISQAGIVSKSGIMVGLGESEEEILQTMDDLRVAGCKVLTIGQYLQPDSNLLPVVEYVRPEVFEKYRVEGLKRGFSFVESSPLVRSSYHAERHVSG
ncbi:MAG TPA: lipoyl synthase [Prolixibacteraceae bacterium]|nr:lipoyl synthase [Prolixibacteraceae bacterium]